MKKSNPTEEEIDKLQDMIEILTEMDPIKM